MDLTTARKWDVVWLLDWSRNLEAYGIGYARYEAYRLRHGRKPPKAGSGTGLASPRHRAIATKGSAA